MTITVTVVLFSIKKENAFVPINDTVFQYEELIDQFKNVHREFEALRTSGFSTAELRRDITAMEEERDLVLRRVERMKQKVSPLFLSLSD